jgi:hypothetical protein
LDIQKYLEVEKHLLIIGTRETQALDAYLGYPDILDIQKHMDAEEQH